MPFTKRTLKTSFGAPSRFGQELRNDEKFDIDFLNKKSTESENMADVIFRNKDNSYAKQLSDKMELPNISDKDKGIKGGKMLAGIEAAGAGLDIVNTAVNADADIDTSGSTDYGNQKANGGMMTASSTLKGAAAGAKVGGVPGAIIGGTIGLIGGLFGAGKRRRALATAKRRFKERKAYRSQRTMNTFGGDTLKNNIITDKNLQMMENLNSPSYARFKRRLS